MRERAVRRARLTAAGLQVKTRQLSPNALGRPVNGCGVLSILSADGGFCPVRGVMSSPLCGGAVDDTKKHFNVYILTTAK